MIIQIDMASAMKEGIEFFISSNNVILTEGIDGVLPPKFFLKVLRKDLTVIEEKLEKVEKEEKVVAEEPV